MIFVPREATDEQVLNIVRGWIDILADEDYESAFDAITAHGSQETWTPEFIKSSIKNYRSPEHYPGVEEFRVTNWRTAHGGNADAEQAVTWYKPHSFVLAGYINFDLPLNGQWSDLKAEFVLWYHGSQGEGYILGLEDIESQEQKLREWAEEDTNQLGN